MGHINSQLYNPFCESLGKMNPYCKIIRMTRFLFTSTIYVKIHTIRCVRMSFLVFILSMKALGIPIPYLFHPIFPTRQQTLEQICIYVFLKGKWKMAAGVRPPQSKLVNKMQNVIKLNSMDARHSHACTHTHS